MSAELLLDTAAQMLEFAKAAGATSGDAMAGRSTEFEVKVADGKINTLTQATAKGIGLRVFVDGRTGSCVTSDFSKDAMKAAAERAVLMARETAEDPHNGLAEAEAGRIDAGPELDLYDPKIEELTAEEKIAWAHVLESSARAVSPEVVKFRDSGVSNSHSDSVLVTTTGVVRTMRSSGIALWASPIAERDGELQSEFWYDSKTHLEDLESPEEVGRKAGERAQRMLGAKPIPTQSIALILEPQMAAGFVAGILGAVNGDMVYKKASFLADKLGESIASPMLSLVDDPHVVRGASSAPFDDEGVPTYKKDIIRDGVLKTFLYDSYTARKAGKKPNAAGRRGLGGNPHPGSFNILIEAGDATPESIYDVERGFVLTRGLGSGVSSVTGEYSRGANGLLIENGKVVQAVQEVTIAGDFIEMLKNIDAVGNDFVMRGSAGAPTIRIKDVALSGK